jgi:hypothetical protein
MKTRNISMVLFAFIFSLSGAVAQAAPPTRLPDVSITSPASGSIYTTPQTVSVAASASEKGSNTITKVDFYDGTALMGTSTASPYSYNWAVSSATNGTHSWTAKAYDSAGGVSTSAPVSLTVNVGAADTTPPSVSISSPASGTTYTSAQTVTISASASDNVGVSRVEFYEDGSLMATDAASPYSYAWPVSSSNNGTHSWTAKAYDAAGNSSTSGAVSLTVNIGGSTTTIPNAPSNLTATAASSSQVNLAWQDNSTNETNFEIWRYQASTGWVVLPQVGENVVSYTDTGLSPSTSYYYMVRAINTAGASVFSNMAGATTLSGSTADTTPPIDSISSPTSGTTYTTAQTVTITASASDNVGVTKVEFYDGGVLKATDAASPYTYAWPISSSNNGTHSWTSKAYDAAGNVSTSSAVSLTVNIAAADTTPPTVSISSPASGSTYTLAQTVTISASASDNVGVTKVEFYDGGVLKATDTSPTYSYAWTFTSANNGTHSWTAKAYDAAGNVSTSSAVSLTVNIAAADATPPSVSISSPASGTTYTAAGTVTITAAASDNVGVAKVEFYDGTTLMATDTASPYTCAWSISSANNGTHSWTAKAYDAAGNTAVSGAVSLNVSVSSGTSGVWARSFGSSVDEMGKSVAVDGSGNIVTTGSFAGTVDFGTGPLTSNVYPWMSTTSYTDVFLAKYASSGTALWSRRIGGTANDVGYGTAVDGNGDVIVAGAVAGPVDFGNGVNSTYYGGLDIFIAKYSGQDGSYKWAKQLGGSNDDLARSVAVDGSGNVYVTGSIYSGTVDFGGGPLSTAPNAIWGFIAKYSPSGSFVWAKIFGSTIASAGTTGTGVGVDSSGNVIVTGQFAGTVDFGGGPVTISNTNFAMFILKLSSSGAYQWSKTFGNGNGTDVIQPNAMAVDGSGNVIVTGQFTGSEDLGGGALSSISGSWDGFIAKYSGTNGAPLWSKSFGAAGYDLARGVAVDGNDNVIVTGSFYGSVDFGGGPLTSYYNNVFVAKYSAAGAYVWAENLPGGNAYGNSVAVKGNSNIAVTGQFANSLNFDPTVLTSAGGYDIFLLNETP